MSTRQRDSQLKLCRLTRLESYGITDQIDIDLPSFQTDYQWELTSLGYVGYLPITPDLTFALRPKVPLRNLFGMLEYAYRLDFKLFEGLVDCATLEEFYERLANVLAKRIIDRQRRGLHRHYVPRTERSGFIRGRLDLMDRVRRSRLHFRMSLRRTYAADRGQ